MRKQKKDSFFAWSINIVFTFAVRVKSVFYLNCCYCRDSEPSFSYSNPFSFILRYALFVTMIWSISWMPSNSPASLSCVVIAISCGLGSREPDGWL